MPKKKKLVYKAPPKPTAHIGHKCGECANCEVNYKFNTLSIKGEPTLGKCPESECYPFCVLLSDAACVKFKPRINEEESQPPLN